MGIGGGINGGNSGYIGVVTIVEYFSTLLLLDIVAQQIGQLEHVL